MTTKLVVSQVNPYINRRTLHDYCRANGIIMMAYSPITKGKKLNGTHVGELISVHETLLIKSEMVIHAPRHNNNFIIGQSRSFYKINYEIVKCPMIKLVLWGGARFTKSVISHHIFTSMLMHHRIGTCYVPLGVSRTQVVAPRQYTFAQP